MILAAALALWLPTDASAGERRFAIVVGANHGDAGEVSLRYAEDDADRVADVLTRLGDVAPEDVVELRSPDADTVRKALIGVTKRVAEDRDDTTLLMFYYSGHADADALHLGGTHLPLSEIKAVVTASPADVRIVVLDACRTGELTRNKGATPAQVFAIQADDQLDADGTAIITSAAAGEDAQESDRLQGGVFTHHLVAGLDGAADYSGDGRVTLNEAYRYAYSRTVMTTSEAPTVQHPSYAFDLRGHDSIVLTTLAGGGRGWLRFPDAGEYVLFDPRGDDEVTEVDVGAGAVLSVDVGRYLVRRRTPQEIQETTVSIEPGQTVDLAGLQPLPYGQAVRRGGDAGRRALSLQVGGGLTGPEVPGWTSAGRLSLGARVDLAALSLGGAVHGAVASAENVDVTMHQREIGVEVGAIKLVDVGPLAVGPGIRVGGDVVQQRFDTLGTAPARSALALRAGPWLRAEVAVAPRASIGLDTGFDSLVYPAVDDAGDTVVTARVVPRATVDVSLWVF